MHGSQPIILCLASYFKGSLFLEEAKRQGAYVILVTREKIKDEAWPLDSIDERFLMPSLHTQPDITNAVSYLMREREIDRIVPLDDYDVPTAAALREHLRLSGMGETTTRYFRDKLAMRQQAQRGGVRVPAFTPPFSYGRLHTFMETVPAPWALKPRAEAGAMGIKKCTNSGEVWHWLNELGDEQSHFVLEQFVPGDVYHVDSIVWGGEVLFAVAQKYGRPPINVAHDGGVFISRVLDRDSAQSHALLEHNQEVTAALGMINGVMHTEFIRSHDDGAYYFLETAARVGGAGVDKLPEGAAGVNLWREWARLEVALAKGEQYVLPPLKDEYAGILVCLARQEYPDLSAYNDPEVWWRMDKKHHAGLVVVSADANRVAALLDHYAQRFAHDFLAVAPPLDRAPQ